MDSDKVIVLVLVVIVGAVGAFSQMDFDGDGLKNYEEWTGPTDWRNPDSDGDGLKDRAELDLGSNPTVPDTDGDGLKDPRDPNPSTYDILAAYGLEENLPIQTIKSLINTKDLDGDYISNELEVKRWSTDPLKLDTDNGGLDDFNEVYVYKMDPNDPSDDKEFKEDVRDGVKNIQVKFKDMSPRIGGTEFTGEKFITIATRDPLVQWFAEHTEIDWGDDPTKGRIRIPDIGEPIEGLQREEVFPAWYLTHGKDGTCYPTTLANCSIFRLKGYKTEPVGGDLYSIGHEWTEAYKDNQIYVFNNLGAHKVDNRQNFYENEKIGLEPDNDYDPDWFKER